MHKTALSPELAFRFLRRFCDLTGAMQLADYYRMCSGCIRNMSAAIYPRPRGFVREVQDVVGLSDMLPPEGLPRHAAAATRSRGGKIACRAYLRRPLGRYSAAGPVRASARVRSTIWSSMGVPFSHLAALYVRPERAFTLPKLERHI